MWVVTFPAIPICLIQTFTYLSYVSMSGILLATLAFFGILIYCFSEIA